MSFDYNSNEWAEEREDILEKWKKDGGRCARCGVIPDSPHVHHVYGVSKRIYQVLCPDCHADIHDNRELAEKRRPQIYICNFCGHQFRGWFKDEYGRNVMMDWGSERHRCSFKRKSNR
jgi:NMD protein affecting ribosome stability and mRNA decay